MVYVDASFADCVRTNKSTSGCFIALAGPNTFIPIAAICKKQTCVSHSSTESEIVAAELGLRTEVLPLLTLWDLVVEVMRGKAPTDTSKESPIRFGGGICLQRDAERFRVAWQHLTKVDPSRIPDQ